MKTIIIEQSPLTSTLSSWYFIADSALVNAGKPFFFPEFADEFEAFLAPVVRFQRIGKSIGSRFASRYYAEIAPGVHFRASRLRRELLAAGLPPDPSHSFDRSMTVGDFIPVDSSKPLPTFTLWKNGEKAAEWTTPREEIDKQIERVSATNTIKMGDYLAPSLCGPMDIKIGDRLTVTLNNATPLDNKELLYIAIK